MSYRFDNRYAALHPSLTTREVADPASDPRIFAVNQSLADDLGLTPEDLTPDILTGQTELPGGAYTAMAYAGHQFGHWNPQLGDGRALMIGEHLDPEGRHWDVQLKGSGRTAWSRGGDGKAWLGPVLREYVVSEAMHALGIPTTRALAAVTTGDQVYREALLPGAVLTRVAPSHLRVGVFQFFSARGEIEPLEALFHHACTLHGTGAITPSELLEVAVAAQARLVAQWMSVGFIHGVMNTDNAHIGGMTIDYGPCAFMDSFRDGQVYSSIDRGGRYAYNQQPQIAAWNMAQFATALLPLMPDRDAGIEEFTKIVNGFAAVFQAEWHKRFAAKLGISDPDDALVDLIAELLALMERDRADFTNTFRTLARDGRDQFLDRETFDAWAAKWRAYDIDEALMDAANPAVVPRNHRVEEMITAAVQGDRAPFEALSTALATPYADPTHTALTHPPKPDEVVAATFCGT